MDADKMEEVCRTCLSTSDNMECIFQKKLEIPVSLKDMLISFCAIELESEDGLGEKVCEECSLETLRAYNFKLKCERADSVLRSRALAANAPKLEPVAMDDVKIETDECVKSEGGGDSDACVKSEPPDDDYAPSSGPASEDEMLEQVIAKERKKKAKIFIKTSSSRDKTERKIFECPKCHEIFKSFNMISKHLYKVHLEAILTLVQLEAYVDGLAKQRKGVGAAVPEQRSDKTSDAETKDGDARRTGSGCYKCTVCEFRCSKFREVKNHIVEHKGERYIQCDECEYKCSGMKLLIQHKGLHRGERPYGCTQCAYRTTSTTQLRNHTAVVHSDEKPYSCSACAYRTKLKVTLRRHISHKHENRRDHVCGVCKKGFYTSKDLQAHTRTHTGEKPHVCEHCAMAFSQKSNLLKHVTVVHTHREERPFACDRCVYRTRTVHDLRSHMRRHSGERPYACHLCGNTFTAKYTLKIHLRRHSGEKTFSCEQCLYSCYDTESLRAHKRIHTGEKPFACDECGYRARTMNRLRNHSLSHKNNLKYSCQHCPYKANYRSNLIKHLEKNCSANKRKYTRLPGSRYAIKDEKIPCKSDVASPKTEDFSTN